ncbi:acyl- dehydrogenase [Pyrenophora seminiperda CCB06]|uniref:Acyl-dehydrogenase n=1 Tax=Pyrenophora seminiperda CCB06 TaxID=1302712 RepID=A0A3M7M380_9PLEO|nr:acyl- dehydrogenase [Pyrenophora seminiperda CCB06]
MSASAYLPFSEPPYVVGLPSPYYKETHLKWQKSCREFVDRHLLEKALEWDTDETVPEHVWDTFAKAGMLLPTLPAPLPVEWLKKLGIHDILGVVKVEEWDYIHTMIYADEKWITNGIWSDYATMAVRTSGPGPTGLSMVVVPLKAYPGVSMRRLKVGGQVSAGTTFIELDDVKVPVENLIGEEGMGMKYIMTNFNHERLIISIGATRQARVALSAAVEYVLKREAFGKPLVDQPVVRHRLAKAGALLESQWAWVEQFVYQMVHLPKVTADVELGGLTAMVKAQSGIVLNECAQTAQLLFGGNGYTKSGQGELVERIYREVPGIRIPGGSEDVMLDLGVRQLVKNFKSKTKAMERPRGESKL